jgi:hypothetical protein
MRQFLRGLSALAATLVVGSCGSDDGTPSAGSPKSLLPADEAIAAVLYAGTPRTPDGFLGDPAPPSFAQVTTYQIKSTQLGMPAATSHEVCTDDWSEALAWSEEVAAAANPYLDLAATETTASYFEFGRTPRGLPDQYVRQRVFRCAYLDRTGVDLTAADGFAGVLNVRPLDVAVVRDLVEYLWRFTSYNNAGHAVIASDMLAPDLAHSLTLASLERAVGGTTCDRVTVHDLRHGVDADTGVMVRDIGVVREFGVRLESGALVGC